MTLQFGHHWCNVMTVYWNVMTVSNLMQKVIVYGMLWLSNQSSDTTPKTLIECSNYMCVIIAQWHPYSLKCIDWYMYFTGCIVLGGQLKHTRFLPRDAMHKLGLCRHAVSVCLSVTFVDHVKTNKHIFEIFSPSGSHAILVFPYQTGWWYSHGNPLNGGIECRWGIGRNRDSGLIAGYGRWLDVRSAKNIYRRWSWVYDAVGHAPLAIDRLLDVRTTKWQKQLQTTMQCRLHSQRRTIECLWQPVAWTNTSKRREQKRI